MYRGCGGRGSSSGIETGGNSADFHEGKLEFFPRILVKMVSWKIIFRMVVVSFVMVAFWGLYYAVTMGLVYLLRFVSLPHWASPHKRFFCGLPSSTVIQFSCPHPGFFR